MKFLASTLLAAAVLAPALAQAAPGDTKNIVIVPGAFIDGSSWHVVHDILKSKGYRVTVVPATHDSLDADIAATRRVLFNQFGNVVLVGGGLGGAVIGHAGDGAKVKALVYVAALAPQIGENASQLLDAIAPGAPAAKPDWAGYYWADRDAYQQNFAAELTPNRAGFMAASQMPTTQAFLYTAAHAAAWRLKPSYAVVATRDRFLHPDTQRMMYRRAHARTVEIAASHAVHVSNPEKVAALIEQAAIDQL
jgi:hypothetical protein